MDRPHPLGVAAGEVVVDGDEVDALAAEPVEVRRQRRDEGLTLTRLHLGDPPEMQRGTAHQLDVEVTLADDPLGGFTRHGERLDGDVVEVGAVGEALAELARLGGELFVGELLQARLEGVDLGHHRLQRLELLAFTGAEDAIEDAHAGSKPTGASQTRSGGPEPTDGCSHDRIVMNHPSVASQLGRVARAERDAEQVPDDEEQHPGDQRR